MQCLEQADVWDDRSDNLSPHNHNARTQLRYRVAYARGGGRRYSASLARYARLPPEDSSRYRY